MAGAQTDLVLHILNGLQRRNYTLENSDRLEAITQYNQMGKELKQLREIKTKLNEGKPIQHQNDSRYQDNYDDLRRENQQLKDQLDALQQRGKSDGKHHNGSRYQDSYDDLRRENQQLKDQLGALQQSGKSDGKQDRASKSEHKLEELKNDNSQLQKQVDELRMRLSKVLGDKVTDGNPNIADLSDPYRPVALAEKFKTVYDEEWVHVYEDLEKRKISETQCLAFLADIVREAELYCKSELKELVDRIVDLALDDVTQIRLPSRQGLQVAQKRETVNESDKVASKRLMKTYIKEMSHLADPGLKSLFTDMHLRDITRKCKIPEGIVNVNKYADKIVEYVWRMQLADPPMVLLWPKPGEPYNRDTTAFYTATGKRVKLAVWPTVLLHAGGSVVVRGVVVAD